MRKKFSIDSKSLRQEAKRSSEGESFLVLEKTANYRIGVGARTAADRRQNFFLEILLHQCTGELDLAMLERNLLFLRALKDRNYSLSCQDIDIFCEARLRAKDLVAECEAIRTVAARMYRDAE